MTRPLAELQLNNAAPLVKDIGAVTGPRDQDVQHSKVWAIERVAPAAAAQPCTASGRGALADEAGKPAIQVVVRLPPRSGLKRSPLPPPTEPATAPPGKASTLTASASTPSASFASNQHSASTSQAASHSTPPATCTPDTSISNAPIEPPLPSPDITGPTPPAGLSPSPSVSSLLSHPYHRPTLPPVPVLSKTDKTTRRAHHAPPPLWVSDAELRAAGWGLATRWGIGTGAGVKGTRAVKTKAVAGGEAGAVTGGSEGTPLNHMQATEGAQPAADPSRPAAGAATSVPSNSRNQTSPPPATRLPSDRSPRLDLLDIAIPSPSAQSASPDPLASPPTPHSSPLADRIAAYVHDFYASLDVRSARPGPGQWTVLAAYLAVRREPGPVIEEHPGKHHRRNAQRPSTPSQASFATLPADADGPLGTSIRLLSLATGVKCIGGVVADRADVLVDMHAEILARRELELLLAEEVWELRQPEGVWRSDHLLDVSWDWEGQAVGVDKAASSEKIDSAGDSGQAKERCADNIVASVIGRASDHPADAGQARPASCIRATHVKSAPRRPSGRFRVRADTEVWLYTSHAPCGAASNAAHLARMDREDDMLRTYLERMGIAAQEGGTRAAKVPRGPAPHRDSAPPPIIISSPEADGIAPPMVHSIPTIEAGRPISPSLLGGISASTSDAFSVTSDYSAQSSSTTLSSTSTFRSSRLTAQPPLDKKPSRPDARATTAYSCSDKLSRYQALGYQGGRLSKAIEPVRLAGLIVGEEFDEDGIRKLFGGSRNGWSRMQDGIAEVVRDRFDEEGLAWLQDIPAEIDIQHTSVEYQYGRAAALRAAQPKGPSISPEEDAALSPDILALPFPILRDHIIPRPPISPFSIATSWHAGAYIEVVTPTGRDSRVPKVKKTDESAGGYNAASRTRISRYRMWDAWKRLRISEREDEKGSPGWRTASAWMEETGPFKGWHENVNRRGLEGRVGASGPAAESRDVDTAEANGSSTTHIICHEL